MFDDTDQPRSSTEARCRQAKQGRQDAFIFAKSVIDFRWMVTASARLRALTASTSNASMRDSASQV